MGIGKLQGKLDEMVQWGGGEGEAGLQTLIFFSQRMDWNIPPPPQPQQQQQQQQMCSTQ